MGELAPALRWETRDALTWMLDAVANHSVRKWRLYAVACCRHFLHRFTSPNCPDAVTGLELFADNRLPAQEWDRIRGQVVGLEGSPRSRGYDQREYLEGQLRHIVWCSIQRDFPRAN